MFNADRAVAEGRVHTVAVDFDGTLCEGKFPDIGAPKPLVIEYVKAIAERGARIILHTCREDGANRPLLTEAVRFCETHGIPIYAVNENPEAVAHFSELYGTGPPRKLYADEYLDDKAVNTADIEAYMARERDIKKSGFRRP